MTFLSVRGITKSFGSTQVLKGIDLDVSPGSLTAILGPSGCGKTTFLRLLAGFARPDTGVVRLGDDVFVGDGKFVPPSKRRLGYVPQEGALFPHLDVTANITFGLDRKARREQGRVDELLDLVGIDPKLRKRFPHELSGGQQQRVALARALAPEPSVVLLDEPFASLDAALREVTGRAVANALSAAGATAILVTHDQDEALSLADQVAVMREGRLVQVGTPQDVYEKPVDPSVAEFVGAAVLLQAHVVGSQASTSLGLVEVAGESTQGSVDVLLRPEQLELSTSGEGVEALVKEVSYFGHDAFVRLTLASNDQPIVARSMGAKTPELGSRVRVSVKGAVSVFPT